MTEEQAKNLASGQEVYYPLVIVSPDGEVHVGILSKTVGHVVPGSGYVRAGEFLYLPREIHHTRAEARFAAMVKLERISAGVAEAIRMLDREAKAEAAAVPQSKGTIDDDRGSEAAASGRCDLRA